MKRSVIIPFLLIPSFLTKAQQPLCTLFEVVEMHDCPQEKTPTPRPTQDEIESRKIAFLAAAIALTPAEAAHFWPVYNEWNQKIEANMKLRHTALRQIRQLSKDKKTDEKLYAQQNKVLIDGVAEEAYITAEAHKAYVTIIGEVRTAKLYLAEEQFRNMLIRELGQNNEGSGNKQK
ncbi:MAG: hypothetical protein LBC84_09890 [Prevotellaceae bacterium]|jgi:hypothetical protein|nr:hypothetical protein [Prevotellaceae bacterium]